MGYMGPNEMRININQQRYDHNNFVKLDLVNLDNETFFHVEGMINGVIINTQFFTHESDFAAGHANDLFLDFKKRMYVNNMVKNTVWKRQA